jgi:hypothetical protein
MKNLAESSCVIVTLARDADPYLFIKYTIDTLYSLFIVLDLDRKAQNFAFCNKICEIVFDYLSF